MNYLSRKLISGFERCKIFISFDFIDRELRSDRGLKNWFIVVVVVLVLVLGKQL